MHSAEHGGHPETSNADIFSFLAASYDVNIDSESQALKCQGSRLGIDGAS